MEKTGVQAQIQIGDPLFLEYIPSANFPVLSLRKLLLEKWVQSYTLILRG